MRVPLAVMGLCFGIVVTAQDIIQSEAPCCRRTTESTVTLSPPNLSYNSEDPSIQIELINQPNSREGKCNGMALIKVNFQPLKEGTSGCVNKPQCGRTMLKLQLELDAQNPINTTLNRDGHMFNIGDSISNDGYGGDYNHQLCDSEIHATYPDIKVYKSDRCGSGLLDAVHDIMGAAIKYVTIYVSNEYVHVTNDVGMEGKFCTRCLFCLNGQDDKPSGNFDIYIGLNTVVYKYRNRTGKGVCKAALSWECPCFW